MASRIVALLSTCQPLVTVLERAAARESCPMTVVAAGSADDLAARLASESVLALFAEWNGRRSDARGLTRELGLAARLRAPLVLLAPPGTSPERVERCLEAGATDVVCQPLADADLRSRLRLLALAAPDATGSFAAEQAPVGIALLANRHFVHVNPALSRILGLARDALLGTDALELVHPDDRDQVGRNHAARVAGKPAPERYIFRMVRPDGRIVWVQDSVKALDWLGQRVTLNFFTDVSDERGAIAFDASSSAWWREVVERAPAMLYEIETMPAWDAPAHLLFVSPEVIALTGYPASHFGTNTQAWHDIVVPEDRAARIDRLRATIAKGRDCIHEYRIVTRDGNTVWVRDHSRVLRAPTAHGPALVQGVVIDITQRVEAEEALLRYKTAVESSNDLIVAADTEGRVVLVNDTALRYLGLQRAEAEGASYARFLPPPMAKDVSAFLQSGLANKAGTIETTVEIPGHPACCLAVSYAPIADRSGRVTGCVVVARDISARRRAQNALEKRLRYERCLSDLSRRLLKGGGEADGMQDALRPLQEAAQCGAVRLSVEGEGAWVYAPGPHGAGARGILRNGANGDVLAHFPARWQQRLKQGEPVHGSTGALAGTPLGARSILALPIMTDGRVWGVLSFLDGEPRDWDAADIVPLQTAAEIVGMGLARQYLQREVLEIADREQSRIGRDLHDGICQDLLGISYVTDHLRIDLESKPKLRPQVERLRQIAEAINQAVTRTRLLARGLSPVLLDPEGIADSLESLAGHISSVFRVSCTFTADPEATVKDPAMATHLYRIVQEATNNSIRHGHAEEIHISLVAGRGKCVLAVQDNGVGFDLNAPGGPGMGLRIMRHRAEMIDCAFRVRSRPGQGTSITCSWRKANGRTRSLAWNGMGAESKMPRIGEEKHVYKTRSKRAEGAAKTSVD